jgi:DNA-directed RNA polymerase subunit M/transcription elongation factor TFIIS
MSVEKMSVEKASGEKTTVEKISRTAHIEKKPAASAGGVQCLRCHNELDSYVFTKFTFLPYGTAGGNVVLECPKCGHIEFMSQNSPLLRRLNAKPVAVGDGD